MKIAAIDVGSNSFHLMVGQVSAEGQVVPIDRAKDMVRLGDSTFNGGVISPEAFARAAEALRSFKKIAERHHCDAVIAAATSATREAVNGGDFVRAMRDETGIDLQVISGEEEARLIYLGARSVLPLGNRRALLIDIGGGSVELMVGDARELYFQKSLKLGVLRLLSQLHGDPVSADDRAHLAEYCHRELEKIALPMQRIGFDFVTISAGGNNGALPSHNTGDDDGGGSSADARSHSRRRIPPAPSARRSWSLPVHRAARPGPLPWARLRRRCP